MSTDYWNWPTTPEEAVEAAIGADLDGMTYEQLAAAIRAARRRMVLLGGEAPATGGG